MEFVNCLLHHNALEYIETEEAQHRTWGGGVLVAGNFYGGYVLF